MRWVKKQQHMQWFTWIVDERNLPFSLVIRVLNFLRNHTSAHAIKFSSSTHNINLLTKTCILVNNKHFAVFDTIIISLLRISRQVHVTETDTNFSFKSSGLKLVWQHMILFQTTHFQNLHFGNKYQVKDLSWCAQAFKRRVIYLLRPRPLVFWVWDQWSFPFSISFIVPVFRLQQTLRFRVAYGYRNRYQILQESDEHPS